MQRSYFLPVLLCVYILYGCSKAEVVPVTGNNTPAGGTSTEDDSTRKLRAELQTPYMWYATVRRDVFYKPSSTPGPYSTDSVRRDSIFALQMLNPESIEIPGGRVLVYRRKVQDIYEYSYTSANGNARLQLDRAKNELTIHDTVITTDVSRTDITARHYHVIY